MKVTLAEGVEPFDKQEAITAIKAFWQKAGELWQQGEIDMDEMDAEYQALWENIVPRIWYSLDEDKAQEGVENPCQDDMAQDNMLLSGIIAIVLPINEIYETAEQKTLTRNGQIIAATLGAVYRLGWMAHERRARAVVERTTPLWMQESADQAWLEGFDPDLSSEDEQKLEEVLQKIGEDQPDEE